MKSFVDVTEKDWFYNEVMEATNLYLEGGEAFISGIPYSTFKPDAPYLYEEHTGEQNKKVFTLSKKINPTATNPLYVYVDGVQTVYKECRDNGSGTSDVELYSAPRNGSVVSFVSLGEPKVDKFGKPNLDAGGQYPRFTIPEGSQYFFDPFSRNFQEYLYAFGRRLKRIKVPDHHWQLYPHSQIAANNIGDDQESYIVSPQGTVYVPFNLHKVTVRFSYQTKASGAAYPVSRTRTFVPEAPSGVVQYTNRFFPNAYITRAEAFHLLDKLRRMLFQRFTDQDPPSPSFSEEYTAYGGQRTFKLRNRFVFDKLEVYVNGKLLASGNYFEFDDHTIVFYTPLNEGDNVRFVQFKIASDRFEDVGQEKKMYIEATGEEISLGGGSYDTWWVKSVVDMEDEVLNDGTHLIEGIPITKFNAGRAVVDAWYNPGAGAQQPQIWFMPKTLMTRAQAVVILNRFRKWAIERFKV